MNESTPENAAPAAAADETPELAEETAPPAAAEAPASADAAPTAAAPTAAAPTAAAPDDAAPTAEESAESDREAIEALRKLSDRLFSRLCRRLPMRTFIAELQRIDRAVYFRYFKGYRPMKIDARHVEKALRKEVFERNNGLLAQLVIYNWDEAEWRLYGDLQKHIKGINEDVEAIESISDAEADPILDDLETRYDQRDVCIATLINGVRVSDEYIAARFSAQF